MEEFARQFGRNPAWVAAVEAGEIEPTLNDLHNFGHSFGLVFQVGFRPPTIVHREDEIPDFASEEEEADWWCTHELGEECRPSPDAIPDEIARILPPTRPAPTEMDRA